MKKQIALVVMFASSFAVHANITSPSDAVSALEEKFGFHKGKRRNHTKGLCFSGTFQASAQAGKYTKSPIFNGDIIPVIGRFSHAGGNIASQDAKAKVFGMALQFKKGATTHKMAMLNLPFFPVPTPEAFVERLRLKSPKEKNVENNEFNRKYPAVKHLEDILSGRENNQSDYTEHYYNSIHTFWLENKKGEKNL